MVINLSHVSLYLPIAWCVRETFSTVQHCVAYSFGQDLSLYWVGFIEPIYKLCMAIASRCTVAVAPVHRTIPSQVWWQTG